MSIKKSITFFGSLTLLLLTATLNTTILSPQTAYASPGDIHTFAGIGAPGYSGDGGLATAAQINGPSGMAVDASGNLYFADRTNQRIRKVATTGKISTIAGTGVAGFSGDGGPATAARLANPTGVTVDALGDVFFTDGGNNRIRKIDPSGTITTVAGNGIAGFSGDGGQAALAAISHPQGLVSDPQGNIYISDTVNNRIRKVAVTGIISTIAGTGVAGFSGDDGPASSARLNFPVGIALDGSGRVYVADCYNQRIRVIDASGNITTLAGNGTYGYSGDGGPAVDASFRNPSGVSLDAAGNVYIADWYNQRVRVVDTSGSVTTMTGTGTYGYSGDGGPAVSAMQSSPFGVAADPSGNVFIANRSIGRIRMVEGPSYALPVSAITWPTAGSSLFCGNPGITITGTASASRGVSYVEVSTDGGATWETARGAGTWSYVWKPQAKGAYIIMSRAADSHGAHETIIDCASVTVLLDMAPPVSRVTSPLAGSVLAMPAVMLTGIAGDGLGSGLAKVEVSTDGGKTWQRATGTATWSYKWTLPSNGAYSISTRATDRAGNVETPRPAVGVTVQVPVTVSTLAPSRPSAMPYQSVTWTAAAYGGDQSYQYQFMRMGPDTAGAYVLVQDWGTSNSWTWNVGRSSVGSNTIVVNVMDSTAASSGGTTTASIGTVGALAAGGAPTSSNGKGSKSKGYTVTPITAITVSSLTPSPATAAAGTNVTWTTAATGGIGSYLYQFMRMGPDTGGLYVVAQDWSAANTWSWATTLAMAGGNTIKVNVENSDGTGAVTKTAAAYTVSLPAIVINAMASDTASPATAGTTVTWMVSASGGSGSYQYQFSRMGPDTANASVVAQAWGTANSWSWTPTNAMGGTNTVMVSVRNSDGTGAVSQSTTYTITPVVTPIVVGSITPSIASPDIAGTAVTWTASATGGTGSYQYQFSRTGPDTSGSAVIAQAWGTSRTWSWTPASAMVGSNTITVSVRNSDGTGAVSSTAPAYTVNPIPVSTGPAGYWKFDETSGTTTADSSGNNNTGTLSGAVRVSGISSNAVSFGGTGTYVVVTGASSLKPASTVSVTAWVKTSTTGPSGGEVLSMGDNYVLRVLPDGNALFFFYNGTAWNTVQTTGVNVLDGQWHHLAGVKSSSQLQVFVDGALKASYATTDTIGYTLGTDLYLGKHGNGSVNYNYNGVIDEARVYNRDLSVSEVQGIFASTPVPAPAPTPIAVGSLASNPASATAGTSVSWTATATGGSGGYQYQFSRTGPDTGGSAVVAQAWSSSNTWTWATTTAMAGSDTITVSVKDSAASQATKSAAYTLATPGTSPTTSYYGTGVAADSLNNICVTGSVTVSYRMRARQTGSLQAIRPYFMGGSGYAAGTGGALYVTIQTDDGSASHLPSGTVLASATVTNLPTATNSNSSLFFPLITLSTPVQIQAGQLYHVVWKNVDSSPNTNYTSLDELYKSRQTSPMQPTISDTDLAVLRTDGTGTSLGSGWYIDKRMTPTIEFDYSDGSSEGLNYMEDLMVNWKQVTGVAAARETITVSGTNRSVNSVSVYMARQSGTDPVTFQLQSSSGTVIAQGTVPASNWSNTGATCPDSYSDGLTYGWGTASFGTTVTLAAGQSYYLVVSSPSTSVYHIYPLQDGSGYGFKSGSGFHDGHAQFNSGSGWTTGWDDWGDSCKCDTDTDLQFYFTGTGSTPMY